MRIQTVSEGTERIFTAFGQFRRSADGFTVGYRDGKDSTELTYSDGVLTMERRGELRLFGRFSGGLPTSMQFYAGRSMGEVPIRTDVFRLLEREGHIAIVLAYSLLFGDEPISYRLNLDIFLTEVS